MRSCGRHSGGQDAACMGQSEQQAVLVGRTAQHTRANCMGYRPIQSVQGGG